MRLNWRWRFARGPVLAGPKPTEEEINAMARYHYGAD
jgi:hypothetical protein